MQHFRLCCLCIAVIINKSEQNINVINAELMKHVQEDVTCRKCIHEVVTHYCDKRRDLFVTNMNLNLFPSRTMKTIDLNDKNLSITQTQRVFYLLDLRQSEDVANFYYHLDRRCFRIRAKFVFLTYLSDKEKFEALLRTLSEYYISKVLILDKDLNAYAYFPYKYENLNHPDLNPRKIGRCSEIFNNRDFVNAQIYPKLWRNSSINIYFRMMPPYANAQSSGTEQGLMLSVLKLLGFRINMTLGENEFQGIKQNGTYQNSGLELLNRRLVHIVSGGYKSYTGLRKNFDSGPIGFIGGVNIFTPKSLPSIGWYRMFGIFSPEVKYALLITTIIWILFVKTFYRIDTSTLILTALMIYCQTPIPKLSKYKFRIPLASWILAIYVVSVTVLSLLQGIFFSTSYNPEIHSLEDVLRSNLQILVPQDVLQSFNQSNKKIDQRLSTRMIPCTTDIGLCLTKVCVDRAAVIIGHKTPLMMEALDVCYTKMGERKYHLGEQIDNFYLQIYYVKGFPPRDAINDVVLRSVFHAGMAMKEYRENMERYRKAVAKLTKSKLKFNSLRNEHLMLVYSLWIFGLGLSGVALLFEVHPKK